MKPSTLSGPALLSIALMLLQSQCGTETPLPAEPPPERSCPYVLPYSAIEGPIEISQGNLNPEHGSSHHPGTTGEYAFDFDLEKGDPILPARHGWVEMVVDSNMACGGPDMDRFANYVIVDHGDGTYAEYKHLEAGILVSKDQEVFPNQTVIGYVGNTGYTNCDESPGGGYHLHFQVQNEPVVNAQSQEICFSDVPGDGIPIAGKGYTSSQTSMVLGATVVTPTVTEEVEENPIVQIGIYDPIYLEYDPNDWEVFSQAGDDPQNLTNNLGEPAYALRHRVHDECRVHANFGMGTPETWLRQDSSRKLGELIFREERWTEGSTGLPILVVFQYPYSESGYGLRIEVWPGTAPYECLEAAEDVLISSESLIWSYAPAIPSSEPTPGQIGSHSVWEPNSGLFFELQQCHFNLPARADCITSIMTREGANEDAISFVEVNDGEFFLVSFTESGIVDSGIVFHPTRANNNWQLVFINGSPALVAAEDAWELDIARDPNYSSISAGNPNLIMWGSEPLLEAVHSSADGVQRFVVSFPIYKGCHACGLGGYALAAFNFDASGQYIGKTLLGVGPSKPPIPPP